MGHNKLHASEHLNTGGDKFSPTFENMRTVSQDGSAQYDTIQSAIDSILDASAAKEYVVLVYPGEYAEELTIPTHITLFGHSRTKGPLIKSTGSLNPLITINDNNGVGSVGFRHIGFEINTPQNNASIFKCEDGATYSAVACRMTVNVVSDNIKAYVSTHTGTGLARFDGCLVGYNQTGTSATEVSHQPFYVAGSSHLVLTNTQVRVATADENDNFHIIDNRSTNTTDTNFIKNNRVSVNCANASYAGDCVFYFTDKKDVLQEIAGNNIIFSSASGTGDTATVVQVTPGTGAVAKTTGNFVRFSGFSAEYFANVASGDTVVSHFDDVEGTAGAELLSTGAGAFGYVYSPSDGVLRVSDHVYVPELFIPGASTNGIKIGDTTPTFGWADITADIVVKGGANTPTWAVFRGNLSAYQFDTVNDEVWQIFHIPHDYVPGTDVLIHAHWGLDTADATNSIAWTFNAAFGLRNDTTPAAFSTETTVTATHDASVINVPQYGHVVSEAALTGTGADGVGELGGTALAVDGLVMVKTSLTADAGGISPFLFTVDLHYQSTGIIGTKDNAPPFYV